MLQGRRSRVVYGGRNDSLVSVRNAVTPHGTNWKKKELDRSQGWVPSSKA